MKRISNVLVLILLLFVLGISSASAQGPPNPLPVPPNLPPCGLDMPDHVVFPCGAIGISSEGISPEDRANIVQRAGAVLRFNFKLVNAAAVTVPNAAVLSALLSDPNIIALIPDRPIHAIGKPGGGGGGGQVVPSGVKRIGAAGLSVTGSGVGVAIVDTGLDFNHADLAVSPNCFDAFGGNCQDGHGHGTHVGGIVAAINNSIDVVGVAPGATPYAVKVLNNNGSGTDSTVMAGLDWVGLNANLIRVANMSLGRSGTLDDNPALRASIQALKNLGISVVVAAGNDPKREVSEMVPATYPEVMAIASTTALDGTNQCKFFSGVIKADTASYFTTDGKFKTTEFGEIGVTISAPGEDKENISKGCIVQSVGILSLKLGGGTTRMSGTSMAAPHVAGVVALMVQAAQAAGLTLDPEAARTTIRTTAFEKGSAPLDSPVSSYTFDGEREGIVSACGALGVSCP